MREGQLEDSGIRETIAESRYAHDFSTISKGSAAERRRVWQFT